jgi:hypothetical protein
MIVHLALVVSRLLDVGVKVSHISEVMERASSCLDDAHPEDEFRSLELLYDAEYRSESHTPQYIQTYRRSGHRCRCRSGRPIEWALDKLTLSQLTF